MSRRLRTAILAAVLIGASCTPAAAHFVPGCANPADSALNQYCDTVPNAKGPQVPKPGTPAVATALPARLVRGVAHGRGQQAQARRRLLGLPAGPRAPIRVAFGSSDSSGISSGLPPWLILALAALALALIATRIRHRRRRGSSPPMSGQAPA
jgi:hypothetical protein